MNKKLQAARKRFRKQKGNITKGYQNKIYPEGKYTCKVTDSAIKDITMRDESQCCHTIRMQIVMGDHKGGSLGVFPQNMVEVEGVLGSAKNIASILGDVVPGKELPSGEFEVDLDDFYACVEDLAANCIGEFIEVTVKNSKKTAGRQNVYINRGLGSDAKAVMKGDGGDGAAEELGDDDLDYGPRKKKGAKKKAAPRKAVKKKVRR